MGHIEIQIFYVVFSKLHDTLYIAFKADLNYKMKILHS